MSFCENRLSRSLLGVKRTLHGRSPRAAGLEFRFLSPAAFDVDQSSLELIGQNAGDWSGRILLTSVLTESSHVL
jgi:hypothetical protein